MYQIKPKTLSFDILKAYDVGVQIIQKNCQLKIIEELKIFLITMIFSLHMYPSTININTKNQDYLTSAEKFLYKIQMA